MIYGTDQVESTDRVVSEGGRIEGSLRLAITTLFTLFGRQDGYIRIDTSNRTPERSSCCRLLAVTTVRVLAVPRRASSISISMCPTLQHLSMRSRLAYR